MSKRLDSLSFGLPHLGQSLGVGLSCFRFPTTSRMFRSIPIGVCWLLERLLFPLAYVTSMFSCG